MKVCHYRDVAPGKVESGTKGVRIRWLITEKIGAENFLMRHFEIEPGGYTPLHSHPWEHEVFILTGSGMVKGGDEEKNFKQGDAIFIPGQEEHQFKNTTSSLLSFLCLIPVQAIA